MDAPTPRKPDPKDWKVEDYPGETIWPAPTQEGTPIARPQVPWWRRWVGR